MITYVHTLYDVMPKKISGIIYSLHWSLCQLCLKASNLMWDFAALGQVCDDCHVVPLISECSSVALMILLQILVGEGVNMHEIKKWCLKVVVVCILENN